MDIWLMQYIATISDFQRKYCSTKIGPTARKRKKAKERERKRKKEKERERKKKRKKDVLCLA